MPLKDVVIQLSFRLEVIRLFDRLYPGPSQLPVILMYHRVTNQKQGFVQPRLRVSVENFERQMAYLSRHHTFISLRELVSYIQKRVPLPPRAVVLTFDDGFRDFIENVWPILQRHEAPATLFVVTNCLEANKLLWIHKLYYAAHQTGASEFARLCHQVWPAFSFSTNRPAWDGDKRRLIGRFLRALQFKVGTNERENIVQYLFDELGIDAAEESRLARRLYLTWEELRHLKQGGVEVGAHTCSHPLLTALSRTEAEEEIVGSRERLERGLGQMVDVFAYPFSRYNEDVKQILRRQSFAIACAGEIQELRPFKEPLALERKPGENTVESRFAFEMSGLADLLRSPKRKNEAGYAIQQGAFS